MKTGETEKSPLCADKPVCPEIHVNQLGYAPQMIKRAVVAGGGDVFTVSDRDGREVYRGKIQNGDGHIDELSGEAVSFADFSEVKAPGTYFLTVDGEKNSYPFTVEEKPYEQLRRGILHSWYYLRCGCDQPEKYAGEFAHAACHTYDSAVWNGWNEESKIKIDIDAGPVRATYRNVSGGWHDAGDFSKWVTSGATGVLCQFAAYELAPDLFTDDTRIPEAGNGIPDILDEARWELEWMQKVQFEDGGVAYCVFPHYHADLDRFPQEDRRLYYIYPADPGATGDFAAVMAKASRLYRRYDPDFADRCLHCAGRAQRYLEEHRENIPYGTRGYTLGYGSPIGSKTALRTDSRFLAALEMYLATGEERYRAQLPDLYREYCAEKDARDHPAGEFLASDRASFGWLSMLCAGEGAVQPAIIDDLKARFFANVDRLLKCREGKDYGLAIDLFWNGSNNIICRDAIQLAMAMLLEPERDYAEPVQNAVDYLLGRNPLNLTWFTGFGSHPVRWLHYRMGPMTGRMDHAPEGFMPFGAAGYEYAVAAYPRLKEWIPEEVPAMQCFTPDSATDFCMTEFTEGTQGLPLLLFTLTEKLRQ